MVVLVIVGLLYVLPAFIAYKRDVPNAGSIAVIDVFLGWTLVGWVVALAMAVRDVERKEIPTVPLERAVGLMCPIGHENPLDARRCVKCRSRSLAPY